MILAGTLAILFASGISCEHVLVIGEPGNGDKIPIDITVKDGSIVTVSGHPASTNSNFAQSVNLYDFDKQLEARKVIEEDACYIKKITATFARATKEVDAAKLTKVTHHVTEEPNIPGEEIPADQLENKVGAKIAEFCSGYSVFWLKVGKGTDKGRKVKRGWWRRTRASVGGSIGSNGWSVSGSISW